MKDDTNFVRTQIPVIQAGIDRVEQDQKSTRRHALLEWISSTDYPAQQSDIIKRRQEGTGKWFLDASEVAQWVNEASGTLFCPGIPGAGKTMVAAIAVDHLLKSAHAGSYEVAYIYCNYKAQAEQNVFSMLTAVLKQLVQGRPSVVDPVERLHEKHTDRGTKPSLDEIYGILQDVLTGCFSTYVIVDALDECQYDIRRQFLVKIRDLQVRHDVRLMITSRFIPDIESFFQNALKLEVRASEEDVKQFVIGEMYRLPLCVQRNVTLRKSVQERIVEAVDGMYV